MSARNPGFINIVPFKRNEFISPAKGEIFFRHETRIEIENKIIVQIRLQPAVVVQVEIQVDGIESATGLQNPVPVITVIIDVIRLPGITQVIDVIILCTEENTGLI